MKRVLLAVISIFLLVQALLASTITVEQVAQSFEIKEKTLENSNMLYTRGGTESDGTKTALCVALIKRGEQRLVEQVKTKAGSASVKHITAFYDGHRGTAWNGGNNFAVVNVVLPGNEIWLAENRLPEYVVCAPLSKVLRESKEVKIEKVFAENGELVALISFFGAGKDGTGKIVGPQHKFEFRISLERTLVLERKDYLLGQLFEYQIVTQAKEIAPDIWIPEVVEVKNYTARPPYSMRYSGAIKLWKFDLVSEPALKTINFTIPDGASVFDDITREVFVKGDQRREKVPPEEGSIISDYFDLSYSQVKAKVTDLASEQQ